jgi:hypothetical protein
VAYTVRAKLNVALSQVPAILFRESKTTFML